MKSKLIGSFFVVLTLVVGIVGFSPSAFADATVTMTKGSSADQSCVTANNCFDPAQVTIAPGEHVTWTNADTASHTVTSGKPSDNVTGTVFDSSLVKAGGTFSFQFPDAGTFDYYCQVHPWMTGQVIVAAGAPETPEPSGGATTGGTTSGGMTMTGAMTMVQGMSTDGSTQVTIDTTAPVGGQPLSLALTFKDANGNPIQHQNYAIEVTQDGQSVLSNPAGHTHTGSDTQTTSNLVSTNSVDIKVTLNGVGLPGTDPSTWTGPKGDIVTFNVVPEFGPIASLVLVVAIVSVVAVTAKTRGFLKL